MTKFKYILPLLLVLATSCCKEVTDSKFDYSDVMNSINVGATEFRTKCADETDGYVLNDAEYVTESGDTLYISVYVSEMDENWNAEQTENLTKSTLISSSKFGTASGYTSFQTNVYRQGESTYYKSEDSKGVQTEMKSVPISYSSSKWSFDKTYYWPKDNKDLYFCSYAPVSEFQSGGAVTNMTWDKDNHKLTFTYTSPEVSADSTDAERQKDIIIGVNKNHKTETSSKVDIKLVHPLVGVRFVLGNIFGTINSISLKNFYNNATATVDASNAITWTVNTSSKKTFTQYFNFNTVGKDTTGTVLLDTTPDSCRTFLVIPQELASDASMQVHMASTLHPEDLLFSKIIAKYPQLSDWTVYAGKVLTFRISSQKANLVSVDITDEVVGMKKQNIKIVNDGKSPIYIRAVLVGNWLNVASNVLAPWSETKPYGVFNNSFPTTLPANWTYNETDGFYYYKRILRSGSQVSQNLFDTFELTSKPAVTTSSTDSLLVVKSFELDILVQAVSADTNATDILKTAKMAKTAWNISDADVSKYFTKIIE